MMIKTRGFWISLALIILILPLTSAVWQADSEQVWLGLNNNAYVDNLNVRILDVNVEGETARVRITDGSNTLFQGQLTTTDGYTKKEKIKITAEDFRYKDPVHPEVKLKVETWRTVEVSRINFPEEFYQDGAYKVFIIIKNPESKTAEFTVQLASEGKMHIDTSGVDQAVNYNSRPKTVKNSASQQVSIKPGGQAKLYFSAQSAPRVDQGEELNPVFRIYTPTQVLIKEVKMGPIPVTTNKIGHIEDIIAPSVLRAGEETNLQVKFRYSWYAASNDFRIRLRAPEFQVRGADTRQLRAFPDRTQTESFGIIPFGGGLLTVTAEALVGQKVVDTLNLDFSVVGDKIYKITSVEAPEELDKGESGLVFATVKNNGYATNTLSLLIESDDVQVKNPEAVMKLSPGADTRVLYNIKADTTKRIAAFNIKLYDMPDRSLGTQYDRHRKLVDEKVVTINMLQEETEPSIPEDTGDDEEDVTTGDEDTQEPDDVDTEPVTPPTEPEIVNDQLDLKEWWPYIAIGALVLVAILLIILGERKRKKPSLEVYDIK